MLIVHLHVIQFTRYSFQFLAVFCRPQRTFIFYHISFRLSSTFFEFFKKLFRSFPNEFLVVIAVLRAHGRSSDSFYILAYLSKFVKNFFQVFSNFFSISSFAAQFSQTACIWYHIEFHLSRTFFRSHKTFLDSPAAPLSRDSLHIISLQSPFVNT